MAEEEDVAYPWGEDGDALEVTEAELNGHGISEEWHDEEDELQVEVEEDGLAWEGDEAEAAEASIEQDLAFEQLNEAYNKDDGRHERAMLAKLRKDIAVLLKRKIELEPFGSYVTGLGLPTTEDTGGRSDLDMVLLFHENDADVTGSTVREQLVRPTISRLGAWLAQRPGITVKNIIRDARVPIVTFSTRELEVDISVQQPFGVLNSWHLRDLCSSGRPGRLRLLIRLIKLWAKSKSVHSAKDGALSSYGYSMLAAAYLQECGALPALLTGRPADAKGPYFDASNALRHVLSACQRAQQSGGGDAGARIKCPLWNEPETFAPGDSLEAEGSPAQLFAGWLTWLSEKVLSHVRGRGAAGGCGSVPVAMRHIVSVRARSQEELRRDITWSPKREHWSPAASEIFLLIEEPLTGENVARSVRSQGFWAIHGEVERAREFLAEMEGATTAGDEELACFNALLKLPPLATRAQPRNGVGLGAPWHGGAAKRPRDDEDGPAAKRLKGGGKGPRAPMHGVPQGVRLPPMRPGMRPMRLPPGMVPRPRPPARPPPSFLKASGKPDVDGKASGKKGGKKGGGTKGGKPPIGGGGRWRAEDDWDAW